MPRHRSRTLSLAAASGMLVGFVLLACTDSDAAGDPDRADPGVLSAPCDTCDLVADSVTTLGDPSAPASISGNAMFFPCGVSAFGDTLFASAQPVGGGEIALYSPGGDWLRSVGKPGEGPGEFGPDLALLPRPSGGAVVVDRALRRGTVYSDGWEVERVFPLSVRPSTYALSSSDDLFLHARPHPLDPGPVVRFSRIDLETGEETPVVDGIAVDDNPRRREHDQWILAAHPDGGFVASEMWDYGLTLFDRDGESGATATRDAAWLPTGPLAEDFLDVTPLPPSVQNLHVDARGRVWVYIVVHDPGGADWSGPRGGPAWARANYDTRVEVVDLEAQTVLASGQFDEILAPVCGSDYSFTVRETDAGDTRVAVLELRPSGG